MIVKINMIKISDLTSYLIHPCQINLVIVSQKKKVGALDTDSAG